MRQILAFVSFALLLFLAGMFARGAWRAADALKQASSEPASDGTAIKRSGYFLGLTFALTSPWNLGFWLAVIGGQQSVMRNPSFADSLAFAGSVVMGAIVWTLVFSIVVKQGGKFFARPGWRVATQAITSLLMLFFAAKLVATLV